MSTTAASVTLSLPEFRNEPAVDFNEPGCRAAAEQALAQVRSEFGREFPLLIAGERVSTGDLLTSVNPSHPAEIVGVHHKASADLARRAVGAAYKAFPEWAAVPPLARIELLVRAADLIRQRKFYFDALLVSEAGKTWPEAEADVSEAIDFCEYYARQMLRYASPDPMLQLPGERDELVYLPLGVGIIIPPWNFPLAIMVGMSAAALVAGNTVVIKPSSDTPTIAARWAEVLLEAGFPPSSFSMCTGSGAVVGDVLVSHPKTRFISFTGSRDVGLRINELAAKPQAGQIWIKRVVAEMGGKDAIIVDRDANLDQAVEGVAVSAFGYQGQKCSACSRAIVDAAVYNEFIERLRSRVARIHVGPSEDLANYMGPVINVGAKRTILDYIKSGRVEGRLVCGGAAAAGEGYFIQPTVIADLSPRACIFREEIFGPVLAIAKAKDFDEALAMANDSEYGLTGAVYTNDRDKIAKARRQFHVGNLYINRKCTGAMVGAHPFGGFNMSGTDSKAGGPDYLLQFLQGQSIAEKLDGV